MNHAFHVPGNSFAEERLLNSVLSAFNATEIETAANDSSEGHLLVFPGVLEHFEDESHLVNSTLLQTAAATSQPGKWLPFSCAGKTCALFFWLTRVTGSALLDAQQNGLNRCCVMVRPSTCPQMI